MDYGLWTRKHSAPVANVSTTFGSSKLCRGLTSTTTGTSLVTRNHPSDFKGVVVIHEHHDHASTHGMLVFGTTQILMSHLPMFHAPHDFQVLLKVALRAQQCDPEAIYFQDRESSGEKVYTWVPEPFVLEELVAPTPMRSMTGTLFRGHFERGGTPITQVPVTADIVRVLYARRSTPASKALTVPKLLLFGSSAESFAAHVVTRPPDYDQVIAVSEMAGQIDFSGEALEIEIADRTNSAEGRLRDGESFDAVVPTEKGDQSVGFTAGLEVYFETGDLVS